MSHVDERRGGAGGTHQELRVEEEPEQVVRLADLDGGVEARHAVVAGVLHAERGGARRVCARAAALRGEKHGICRGGGGAQPCAHARKQAGAGTHNWAASNSTPRKRPGRMT